MEEKKGAEFIKKKFGNLHISEEVEAETKRTKERGEKVSQKPVEKLGNWLRKLERDNARMEENEELKERVKRRYLYKDHVMEAEEIPLSYFNVQRKQAIERGQGGELGEFFEREYTEKDIERSGMKEGSIGTIAKDQEKSLGKWADYLISSDTSHYPMWAKYWMFQGMLKLSKYDKETFKFGKRSKGTVAPYPELNREALAYAVDGIIKYVEENKKEVGEDEELEKLIKKADFGELYAKALKNAEVEGNTELSITEGEWIRYEKGSEPKEVTKTLEGRNTGWCIASESTAESYLEMGDFYIYYSKNKNGQIENPRITIRMEGEEIVEIRGIAEEQNMDEYIAGTNILSEKLEEFGDKAEEYKKKDENAKRLTEILDKIENKEELNKEDLILSWELEEEFISFGYNQDPRLEKVKRGRDVKEDLAFILDTTADKISLTQEEALSGDIGYHYGDIDLGYLKTAENLKLPDIIRGNLNLDGLKTADNLELPKEIVGNLNLSGLYEAYYLELPEKIGGGLDLSGLYEAYYLELPEKIGGHLNLSGLEKADDLKLPEKIGGYLDLSGLERINNLELPKEIGGYLYLDRLETVENLELPKEIVGNLNLDRLKTTDNLKLPEKIIGNLNLNGLKTADNLELPKEIVGNLGLNVLKTADNLKLPEKIGGSLGLNALKTADNLKLPEKIGGSLNLNKLETIENLKLPKEIGRHLKLRGLKIAKNLDKLLENCLIGVYIDLNKNIEEEVNNLNLSDEIRS